MFLLHRRSVRYKLFKL